MAGGGALGIQEVLNSGHISCLSSLHLGWMAQGLDCDAFRPISKAQSWKESVSLVEKETLAPSPP